jgi:hypothetical protein
VVAAEAEPPHHHPRPHHPRPLRHPGIPVGTHITLTTRTPAYGPWLQGKPSHHHPRHPHHPDQPCPCCSGWLQASRAASTIAPGTPPARTSPDRSRDRQQRVVVGEAEPLRAHRHPIDWGPDVESWRLVTGLFVDSWELAAETSRYPRLGGAGTSRYPRLGGAGTSRYPRLGGAGTSRRGAVVAAEAEPPHHHPRPHHPRPLRHPGIPIGTHITLTAHAPGCGGWLQGSRAAFTIALAPHRHSHRLVLGARSRWSDHSGGRLRRWSSARWSRHPQPSGHRLRSRRRVVGIGEGGVCRVVGIGCWDEPLFTTRRRGDEVGRGCVGGG